jgi:amino-acid N-acetyltransferase
MTAAPIALVRASTRVDFAAIRQLLVASQLPVDDLDEARELRFWVAEAHGHVIGAIALERYGSVGLLRSLVVAASHQKQGLGRDLVATLEREARYSGVELLVLLTQTAETFFHRIGYRVADRGDVSAEIKASAEFRSLCPATALCMTKSLVSPREGASSA